MEIRGGILGLERRATEKRKNRAPLQEVADLSENSFFTRSIRKSRDGYVIFLLDKKTEKGPGSFADASFSLLYSEYASQLKADAFAELADRTLAAAARRLQWFLPGRRTQGRSRRKGFPFVAWLLR